MPELAPSINEVVRKPDLSRDSAATAAVCTVASANYLAHVRAFTKTLKTYDPERRVIVLLVDRLEPDFDAAKEAFEIIQVEELDNIPNPDTFFFKYSVLELNTAVKPYFFEYLFRQYGIHKLVFCDPDVAFFDRMDSVWKLLEEQSIVLTPHILEPYSDGFWPDELQINRAGIYNLGFIGMSDRPSTHAFLRWWKDRLYDQCFQDLESGMHVDQKWVNFAPVFFEGTHTLRDPAYNIAYWNLHSSGKSLEMRDGRLWISGKPAAFFHFSGFDPKNPAKISIHQNRFRLKDLPNLRPLLNGYRDLLLECGYEASSRCPYAYGRFDNGVRIPKVARQIYRKLGKEKARFGNPYRADGFSSFFRFLVQSANSIWLSNHFVPVSRVVWGIYDHRRDLRKKWRDPLGKDWPAFRRWLKNHAEADLGIDLVFLPKETGRSGWGKPLNHWFWAAWVLVRDLLWCARQWVHNLRRKNPSRIQPHRSPTFGANVAGYVHGKFSLGDIARSVIGALESATVPVAVNPLRDPNHRYEGGSHVFYSDENPYQFNLIVVNADHSEWFRQKRGWDYFQERSSIGIWFWELSQFPAEWFPSFRFYREIWVGSSFCQESIARISPIPVVKMTFPVLMEKREGGRDRFGLNEEEYIFLFSFDFLSILERKNPLAVIEAFARAFHKTDKATLMIKTINGHHSPEQMKQLEQTARDLKVRILDECVSEEDMAKLMNACDCFVSLHRAEGLGRGMAQAMYLGKPVIATGYSGNMDFMNGQNSYLVDYKLVELAGNFGPYRKGSVWAEPDIEQAAVLMRAVYENRSAAQAKGERAARDITERMSLQRCGEEMAARLRLLAGN
ncbi:MAG: glycosyltransferase family 4 protein [Candidatus Omnitrophota bacterium]|nr:glycosyltransferase family 4 protein [Candidatus Omnitrophota bacterium]